MMGVKSISVNNKKPSICLAVFGQNPYNLFFFLATFELIHLRQVIYETFFPSH